MMLFSDLYKLETESPQDLVRLRYSSICAAFGNGMTGVVLAIVIAQSLGSFATSAALFALSCGLFISFASGGVNADRANRVHAMLYSDILRGCATLMIFIAVLWGGTGGIIFAVIACLLNGLCAGYFRPASSSLWASLVPLTHLKKTLATNSVYNRFFLTAGGVIGGFLIAADMAKFALFVDAFSFFLTAFLISFLKDPRCNFDNKFNRQEVLRRKTRNIWEKKSLLNVFNIYQ